MKTHWTNRSLEDYVFAIASDFIVQLENKMEDVGISQDELAKQLGRSKGRISQMFNDPKNPTLGKIVEYSKVLGMKVAIVAYEDNDPENKKGPINSEIFKICWEKSGKPRDFWAFQEVNEAIKQALNPAIADRMLYLATAQGTPTDSEMVIRDLSPSPAYVPAQALTASKG